MVNFSTLQKMAMSFPEVTEEPHFEKTSFRVKKKIFATYDDENKRTCIKLNEIDQDVFSSLHPDTIYPLSNKWGKQGWTLIEMRTIDRATFRDALVTAYCTVAPKNLANLIRTDDSKND